MNAFDQLAFLVALEYFQDNALLLCCGSQALVDAG